MRHVETLPTARHAAGTGKICLILPPKTRVLFFKGFFNAMPAFFVFHVSLKKHTVTHELRDQKITLC